jgi:hypothetical protein
MDAVRSHPEDPTKSRWSFILFFAWASLFAWVAFELLRGETFRDDGVALPALALLVTSAVIGSRIYVYLQDRMRRHSAPDTALTSAS